MKGRGTSYGAVSVMNAIPCGIGSVIGIDLRTEAEFSLSDDISIELVGRYGLSTDLVRTCVRRTLESIGKEVEGYHLTVRTDIPPSVGLKSSSSVCNSVISSVLDHYDVKMDPIDIIRLGVRCARESNVTITGSFDDACGCALGGLVVTDNTKDELISRDDIPQYDVVIKVPCSIIRKQDVDVEAYHGLSEEYRSMIPLIREHYLDVMTRNGSAVRRIIGSDEPVLKELFEAGALAAGITGTGPAFAVLTEKGNGDNVAEILGGNIIRTVTR